MVEINTKDIKVFHDGTKIIRNGDVPHNSEIVVIPKSVTKIEKGAFDGIGGPWTFLYTGTSKEFDQIDTEGKTVTPCINCSDGLKILSI